MEELIKLIIFTALSPNHVLYDMMKEAILTNNEGDIKMTAFSIIIKTYVENDMMKALELIQKVKEGQNPIFASLS